MRSLTLIAAVLVCAPLALAYTPGTGTLYTDDFEGALDAGWEMGNGWASPSPWTQSPDGGDTSFLADGLGPFAVSPTEHWARRVVHPASAESFSIAFEYRAELGAGYVFDLEVEQRAPSLRKVRLQILGDGSMSLARIENGAYVIKSSSAAGLIPAGAKRWIRLAFEPDASGHLAVRARVWSGGASSEPSSWTLGFVDELDTIDRVHRFELRADGPKNVDTYVDDLDVWGDVGSGVASSVKTVYVMELSHLDIGFTEPPDDIEAFAKSHLDEVLDRLDQDPGYLWTIENGWWLDRWWERSDELQHQRMIDRLREGRVRLAANYAEFHTTRMGWEEMSRSVYWSAKMAREHEFPLRIYITDDVPGSSFAIPQLVSDAGLEYFVGGMNNGFGGRTTAPDHGDRPFWWVAPDGSRVLSWFSFDSYAEGFQWGFSFFDQLEDLHRKMGEKLPELEETGYPWPEVMILRGFDNHYQGFHVRNLVDQWNSTYETPTLALTTAEDFLDMMLANYGAESFPEYSGDYGAAWSSSGGNQAHITAWVRDARREARAAEALLAVGQAIDGEPDPEDDRAFLYRRILEITEHTGPGGWPGYFTPEEMQRNNEIHVGYAEDARNAADALLAEGRSRATAEIPAAGDAVIAVNPLGRARDGWVRAVLPSAVYGGSFRVVDRRDGSEMAYQRFDADEAILFRAHSLPAVGYAVFDLAAGAPSVEPEGVLDVTPTTLDNDFYALTVDPATGAVTSLVDKKTGLEMIDPASPYAFNELAWTMHEEKLDATPPHAEPPASASVTVDESGPVRIALRVTRTGTPHVETIYRLYRGEDRVEIVNVLDRDLMPYVTLDQHSRAYTVTLPFDVHEFEIRTETTSRFLDPLTDGFERDGVFDYHNAEHVLAFWDDERGVLASSDAIVAHHFEAMTSLTWSEFKNGDGLLLPRLKDKADEYEFEDGSVGSYEVEPGTPPLHRSTHHFRATGPGFDPIEASRFGTEALGPLPAVYAARRPGNLHDAAASFLEIDAPGVLLSSVKPADGAEGVVARLIELRGEEAVDVRLSSEALALDEGWLVERDEEGGVPLTPDGNGFVVSLGPYEMATVRVVARESWDEIDLRVSKVDALGAVRLAWSGGVTPYTLRRAASPSFAGPTTLVDEEDVTSHDDPVLGDGEVWFYLVR